MLFNTLDRVTMRLGAKMHIYPSPKFRLMLEGVWLENESSFQGNDYVAPTYHPITYNSYSITGGISWYF